MVVASMIRQQLKEPRVVTVCSADFDENVLISDFPDDVLELAAGPIRSQALTLGFCTFDLIECPIGSQG